MYFVSAIYKIIYKNHYGNIFLDFIFNFNRHFFPLRRADLAASASLQGIRSEVPRLHALRLASAATSTRE